MPLVGEANLALGKYSGFVTALPDSEMLLAPLVLQEAVRSSRIEGISLSSSQALRIRSTDGRGLPQAKRDDAAEVLNYRAALRFAEEQLGEKDVFTTELLRKTHSILMGSIRGTKLQPGEFRDEQNWVGDPNLDPYKQESYFPPPPGRVGKYMKRLENYINKQESPRLESLLRLAMIHVEYERIHPFMDGNGRTGRLLIPLLMKKYKLLDRPFFYISWFIDLNRDDYYDGLMGVSRDGAWAKWCKFFLEAIISQADQEYKKALSIRNLHDELIGQVAPLSPKYYQSILRFLFFEPIFNTSEFVSSTTISASTSHRIIRTLCNKGILDVIDKGSRGIPSTYMFVKLINVLDKWDSVHYS